jgi:hypothetical protein
MAEPFGTRFQGTDGFDDRLIYKLLAYTAVIRIAVPYRALHFAPHDSIAGPCR